MPNIDIPLPVDLNEALELPPCNEIKLPLPKPLKIQLPTGASIKAIADASKGIPSDCAMCSRALAGRHAGNRQALA